MGRHALRAKLLTVLLAADAADSTDGEITAQQDRRAAPRVATRALFSHEHEARVMFADLEDDLDDALDKATGMLEDLHAQVSSAVMVALFGEDRQPATPAEARQVIDTLTGEKPEEIQRAEAQAATALAGILADTYETAGQRVIEEAGRQGLDVSDLTPKARAAEEFTDQAEAVTRHPWRRITRRVEDEMANQETITRPTVEPDQIDDVLDGIKVDGSRDQARQAINTSGGRGREDTVDETPELEPDQIWASEIMDGNQCQPCQQVDGREFTSMEDARRLYPEGWHINCLGGTRCRGTLIFQFRAGS